MNAYFVYILSNKTNTVLYIGVTNNLDRRVYQHKNKTIPGFTNRYNVNKLIYFEEYTSITDALAREKQLKNWHREWKLQLIKQRNPTLRDLDSETSSE